MSNDNNEPKTSPRGRWVQPVPRDFSPGPGVRAVAVNWNYRPEPVFVENLDDRYGDLVQ